MIKDRIASLFLPSLFLLSLAAFWEIAVWYWKIPHYLLPGPIRILTVMVEKWRLLTHHCLITTIEIGFGFLLAAAVGFSTAVAVHASKIVGRTILPIVIASQTIPVFAIAPLLILWFGYGIGSKVVMTAIIVFFPIVVNTVKGLNSADPDILSLFEILGASKAQIFMKVRLRGALPFIFSGLKIGAAVSVIGAVIGEWVGSREGLGYLMVLANSQLKIDLVFASIALLSVIGVFFYAAVGLAERCFMRI